MLEALLYQQPRLLERARALMDDPALTWRQAFRQFVLECTYGAQSGVAVLSIPEEQEVYHCLSAERFAAFQQAQLAFFSQLLEIFGAPAGSVDPKFFGSAALAMMMVYKGIPKDLPFLFPEAADAMVQFQLDALTAVLARAIDGPSAPADPPDPSH